MIALEPSPGPPRAWTFDDLVEEGLALVRSRAPEWTDHNPSDPGITLVELLAYFSEILVYRALLVSPDARLNLLRLLGENPEACEALERGEPAAVRQALRRRSRELEHTEVAATLADFERLARRAVARRLGDEAPVQVRALALCDLPHPPPGVLVGPEGAGDVCVLVAPAATLPDAELRDLLAHVREELAPRCLLTSRVHVLAPQVVYIGLGGRIVLQPGAARARAWAAIERALRDRFGRADDDDSASATRRVHLAQAAGVIDGCEGVDHVDDLVVQRLARHAASAEGLDVETELAARLGVRPGVHATLGHDARFGGAAGPTRPRLRRGADGEAATVLLHPWEQASVHLVRERVEWAGGDDDVD